MSDRDEKPKRVHARFYSAAVLNETKSKEAGRPIFDEHELVEFLIPGDRLTRPVALANERPNGAGPTYAELYPEEYAAFKRGEQRAASGTPLEQWPNPRMTKARVAELKAVNIFSVEDVAGLSDAQLQGIGIGAREMRTDAQAYIEAAKSGAANAAAAAENADLRGQLAAMQEQIAKLMAGTTKEKALEDCTDDELRTFIERESGKKLGAVKIGRAKLLERAAALATKKAA
jgi:hypothetical protein